MIDTYIVSVAKRLDWALKTLDSQTPFDLEDFVTYIDGKSNRCSVEQKLFIEVDWESAQGKKLSIELQELFER